MIIYRKAWYGLGLLTRMHGSAAPRALVPALLSTALTLLLELGYPMLGHNELRSLFEHPYPYQIFASILGFILVFRTNFAYQVGGL